MKSPTHPPKHIVNRYHNRDEHFVWDGQKYIKIKTVWKLKVGDKVEITEINHNGHVCVSVGEVTKIGEGFYETTHTRDQAKYPNMGFRAYNKIWMRHFTI